jgi:diguanylate cyclase (GGDEF)-like protein
MNPRRHLWLFGTIVLVVLGTLASVFGAIAFARNDNQKSRQAFNSSSAQIASTLKLVIQHEQDLSSSLGAFVVGNPNATQGQFQQWTSAIDAFARYPEIEGLAHLVMVSAAQLPAFESQVTGGHPATFAVLPPGVRLYYCFTTVSQSRTGAITVPAGFDFCDSSLGRQLLATRDAGRSSYVPYRTGKQTYLVLGTPVYQGGVVPATVAARRAAFVGWTGTEVRWSSILADAVSGHPGTPVAFHYVAGTTHATFRRGTPKPGDATTVIDLHNGWRVQTFGQLADASVWNDPTALMILLAGTLFSFLIGAMIIVLLTSRSRAVRMVEERTKQLAHQALHDPLTGLPNRALILDRIGQMFERARREGSSVAALFIDLDNFKDINDTLGHSAGDHLLVAVANRLEGARRQGDTVGRLGGDEFVVLAAGESIAAGAEVVADRMLDALSTPFEVPGSEVPLTVTASVGVAAGDRADPEELLRDADIALYEAKAAGKRRSVVFSPAMYEAVEANRLLEMDLYRALEGQQFFLVYQPVVDLRSGSVTGVEALLRWRHPERGIVQPASFIAALESSGLITPVGGWVLATACDQAAAWCRDLGPLGLFVNVSGRQVERDRLVDDVHTALTTSGFDPSLLTLELTETSLMRKVDAVVDRLKLLKAIGVRLAVDDFGTGYSSVTYLQQFPIDVLKIDRSFTSGIPDAPEVTAILHTLIELGKLLDLEVIAEGVETEVQRNRLRTEGVGYAQGFLFSKPLDATGMDHYLRSVPGGTPGTRSGSVATGSARSDGRAARGR